LPSPGGEAGLTLLEVIVAMAVLTIGITGVLRAFSSGLMTCKASESYSFAALLAQQAASELERRPDLQPGKLSGTFAGDESAYTWEADIRPVRDSGLCQARITVFWPEGNRRRSLQLFTCMQPYSGQQDASSAAPGPGAPQ